MLKIRLKKKPRNASLLHVFVIVADGQDYCSKTVRLSAFYNVASIYSSRLAMDLM